VDSVTAKAFLLIETKVGQTNEVMKTLKELHGVKSVDTVTGPYDIIAIIEEDSLNEIGKLVTEKIHLIPGLSRTATCLAIRSV
jgi:DNA-binding Lrp family transcriptional regulator